MAMIMQRVNFVRNFHGLNQRLQLTLALIKPDATASPYVVQRIRDIILENGFNVVRTKQMKMTMGDAEKFYFSHRERFFYNRLVTFMSSGPIYAHILAKNNAIENWRKLMGPTKTYKAQYEDPGSIRGQFGLTDTRNTVHGSDSHASVIEEIKFFFPGFDHTLWEEEYEQHFRLNNVILDKTLFEHRVVKKIENENLNLRI